MKVLTTMINIMLIIFLFFIWMMDFTPNEGIGEIKYKVEKEWNNLEKEIN
jgi:biopolymer transport protein ExbD